MKNNTIKKAFTLIELLTVVIIIGLIASAALVMLKDTGEVKALQYSKKVMSSMKNAVGQKEDSVFTGFLNDMGTMPPDAHFLLNIENNRTHFINGELDKHRIINLFENNSSDENISMPFIDGLVSGNNYNDSDIFAFSLSDLEKIRNLPLYIGHHGSYIGEGLDGDKSRSVKDGWSKVIEVQTDLNISNNSGDLFLTLVSAGSDGRFADEPSYIKDEFNEFNDSKTIKSFYADDYNRTFKSSKFLPRSLKIDLDDINATKVQILIYSPMLYYVNNSENIMCTENNTTHANCVAASDTRYIPYIPNFTGVATSSNHEDAPDANLSWHVGVIKYAFHYDDDNDASTELSDGNSTINNLDYIDNSSLSNDIDFTTDFYITAGEKQIVILKENGAWNVESTYSCTFMPNRTITLTEDGCK